MTILDAPYIIPFKAKAWIDLSNRKVAGEQVDKKIGELKAKEVLSETLTLCDVEKGHKEIQTNYEKNIPLKVVSRAKKQFDINKAMNTIGI